MNRKKPEVTNSSLFPLVYSQREDSDRVSIVLYEVLRIRITLMLIRILLITTVKRIYT
jgi:hypothetical protein